MGGKSSKTTVGYKNYAGAALVLAKLVHKIKRISIGDKDAWEGSIDAEGTIFIDKPKLYEATGTEGGFVGTIAFQPGLPTQMPDSYLLSKLGPDISASRGVSQLVLRQPYLGNNPYIKDIEATCERIHLLDNGSTQWYDAKAEIPEISSDTDEFIEKFAAGLTGYSIYMPPGAGGTIGSLSNFSIVSSPYGRAIQIAAGTSGTHPAIKKALPNSQALQECHFKVELTASGNDDCGLIAFLDSANNSVFNFNIKRDSLVDSNRRPTVAFVDQSGATGNPIGPNGGVTLNRWYQVDVIYTATTGQFYAVMTDLTDNSVYGSINATVTGRHEITQISFQNDNTHGAGACRFADIHILTAIPYGSINPAHVIRECLTNPEWGFGYDEVDIDDDSFMAAADKLYTENFGMGYLWDDDSTQLEDVINKVTQLIDGNLYVDRNTLKWTLTLVRNDYDPDDLIELRADYEVSAITNYSRPEFLELKNTIILEFYNNGVGGNGSITGTNAALFLQQGVRIAETKNYEMCSNPLLAAVLLQRELNVASTPLASCTVVANSAAKDLRRGSVFKLTSPRHNFNQTIVRVTGLTRGDNTTKQIKLNVVEDRFAMPQTAFIAPQPPGGTDPGQNPLPIPNRLAIEIPYALLLGQDTQANIDAMLASDPDVGFFGVAAARVTGASNANVFVDAGAGYEDLALLDFCGYGELTGDIGYLDNTFTLTNFEDLDEPDNNTVFQIDSEILSFGSKPTALGNISSVKRGLFDTVPTKHLAGAKVFFIQDYLDGPERQYAEGESVDIKLASNAVLGQLDLELADVDTVTFASRAIKPYPPGALKFNGTAYPTTVTGALTVTWKHRNRLTQADTIVDTTQGDVTPEVNTRYTLEFYNAANVLIISRANIGPGTAGVVLNYTGNVTLKLWAVTDNGASIQKHSHTFAYTPPGGTTTSTITATDYTRVDNTTIIDGGGA